MLERSIPIRKEGHRVVKGLRNLQADLSFGGEDVPFGREVVHKRELTGRLELEDIPFELEDIRFKVESISFELESIPFKLEDLPFELESIPFKLEDLPFELEDLPFELGDLGSEIIYIPRYHLSLSF